DNYVEQADSAAAAAHVKKSLRASKAMLEPRQEERNKSSNAALLAKSRKMQRPLKGSGEAVEGLSEDVPLLLSSSSGSRNTTPRGTVAEMEQEMAGLLKASNKFLSREAHEQAAAGRSRSQILDAVGEHKMAMNNLMFYEENNDGELVAGMENYAEDENINAEVDDENDVLDVLEEEQAAVLEVQQEEDEQAKKNYPEVVEDNNRRHRLVLSVLPNLCLNPWDADMSSKRITYDPRKNPDFQIEVLNFDWSHVNAHKPRHGGMKKDTSHVHTGFGVKNNIRNSHVNDSNSPAFAQNALLHIFQNAKIIRDLTHWLRVFKTFGVKIEQATDKFTDRLILRNFKVQAMLAGAEMRALAEKIKKFTTLFSGYLTNLNRTELNFYVLDSHGLTMYADSTKKMPIARYRMCDILSIREVNATKMEKRCRWMKQKIHEAFERRVFRGEIDLQPLRELLSLERSREEKARSSNTENQNSKKVVGGETTSSAVLSKLLPMRTLIEEVLQWDEKLALLLKGKLSPSSLRLLSHLQLGKHFLSGNSTLADQQHGQDGTTSSSAPNYKSLQNKKQATIQAVITEGTVGAGDLHADGVVHRIPDQQRLAGFAEQHNFGSKKLEKIGDFVRKSVETFDNSTNSLFATHMHHHRKIDQTVRKR
ncbi:unnamed protein product, partial [Amoebophrya sp. A120]